MINDVKVSDVKISNSKLYSSTIIEQKDIEQKDIEQEENSFKKQVLDDNLELIYEQRLKQNYLVQYVTSEKHPIEKHQLQAIYQNLNSLLAQELLIVKHVFKKTLALPIQYKHFFIDKLQKHLQQYFLDKSKVINPDALNKFSNKIFQTSELFIELFWQELIELVFNEATTKSSLEQLTHQAHNKIQEFTNSYSDINNRLARNNQVEIYHLENTVYLHIHYGDVFTLMYNHALDFVQRFETIYLDGFNPKVNPDL